MENPYVKLLFVVLYTVFLAFIVSCEQQFRILLTLRKNIGLIMIYAVLYIVI